MSTFEQLKSLYENGLYSNVIALGSFAMSISDNRGDEDYGIVIQYQTMVLVGKSLKEHAEFKRAEALLQKALNFSKAVTKTKAVKAIELYKDSSNDVELKYMIAECHLAVKDSRKAIATLESIAQKHRTAKINMTLGKLYKYSCRERPAIVAFKEVLRDCPLALEAIEFLLSLGVQPAEILSLITSVSNSPPVTSWISTWMKGHAAFQSKEYETAITQFKCLEETTALKRNPIILISLGESYYLSGDAKSALDCLKKARTKDPLNLEGIDLMASILAQEKLTRELESLSLTATAITDNAAQPWIAIGYYSQLTKRVNKAIYFAHKACSIDPRSVEGLLLKGSVLLEMKKNEEAIMHFREAMQLAPHRFEPTKGLVDCYMAMSRPREAVSVCVNAMKVLGHNAQVLTLYACVLLKESAFASKGKFLLDKALRQDPYYLPAVHQLCETLMAEGKYVTAIELLIKQVAVQSTHKLHQMLSECYTHCNDEEKAAYHFSIALTLSQGCESPRPLEASSVVEPGSLDGLEMDVDDPAESEGDVEEAEMETVWSDVDFSFNAQS